MTKLKKMPYMPLYSDDWLASRKVNLLPLDAQGLFIRCLLVQWEGGELPESPEEIALLVGNPPGFNAAWHRIANLFQKHNKGLANLRGIEIKREWDDLRTARADAGKHGGHPSKQKDNKPEAKSNPPTPTPTPTPIQIQSPPKAEHEAASPPVRPPINEMLNAIKAEHPPASDPHPATPARPRRSPGSPMNPMSAECREALDYLGEVSGAPRSLTAPGEIGRVLTSGQGTIEDIKLIIDWWAARVKAGPDGDYDPDKFFDQNSPFWQKKFDKNLRLATSWQLAGRPAITVGKISGPRDRFKDHEKSTPEDLAKWGV